MIMAASCLLLVAGTVTTGAGARRGAALATIRQRFLPATSLHNLRRRPQAAPSSNGISAARDWERGSGEGTPATDRHPSLRGRARHRVRPFFLPLESTTGFPNSLPVPAYRAFSCRGFG